MNSFQSFSEKRKYNIFGDPSVILKSDIPAPVSEIIIPVSDEFYLAQNYTNPFNPNTTIKYSIPNVSAELNQRVVLKIYNILGKEIVTLVNQNQSAGSYEITFEASNLPSGIYFYTLTVNNFIQTRKMILLK